MLPCPSGGNASTDLAFCRGLDESITGRVFLARELHAALGGEGFQQGVHRCHDVGIAADFEDAVPLDLADAVGLDVAGDEAGEGAAQLGGEAVRR